MLEGREYFRSRQIGCSRPAIIFEWAVRVLEGRNHFQIEISCATFYWSGASLASISKCSVELSKPILLVSISSLRQRQPPMSSRLLISMCAGTQNRQMLRCGHGNGFNWFKESAGHLALEEIIGNRSRSGRRFEVSLHGCRRPHCRPGNFGFLSVCLVEFVPVAAKASPHSGRVDSLHVKPTK